MLQNIGGEKKKRKKEWREHRRAWRINPLLAERFPNIRDAALIAKLSQNCLVYLLYHRTAVWLGSRPQSPSPSAGISRAVCPGPYPGGFGWSLKWRLHSLWAVCVLWHPHNKDFFFNQISLLWRRFHIAGYRDRWYGLSQHSLSELASTGLKIPSKNLSLRTSGTEQAGMRWKMTSKTASE